MIVYFLRFVVLYSALLLPWSFLNQPTCSFLRAMGASIYGGIDDRKEIDFEPLVTDTYPYGLRVVIVNRALMNRDGSGPVRNLDVDARGLLFKPVALLIALSLCTPISWKRRFSVLFWCLLWENVFVLLFLGFCIWHESTQLSLVTLTPTWKQTALDLRQALQAQCGLAIPLIVWIMVAFRRGDQYLIDPSSEISSPLRVSIHGCVETRVLNHSSISLP